MYKLVVVAMLIAVASAGLIGAPLTIEHAPIAVAHAPVAVAVKSHGATSYANSNLISGHHTPIAIHTPVVHAAPVVHAVHAAPAIAVSHHGIGLAGLH